MKIIQMLIICLISFTVNQTFAQPGDPYRDQRVIQFSIVQDSIKKYPNDLFYRWVRLEHLFSPQVTLYFPQSNSIGNSHPFQEIYHYCDSIAKKKNKSSWHPDRILGNFLIEHIDELIEDLNQLIASGTVIKSRSMQGVNYYDDSANNASYLLKRGQMYYLSGVPNKAISDYQAVLENNPSYDIERKAHTLIAVYYISNNESNDAQKNQLALKHIRLAEPAIEDSTYLKGSCPDYYILEMGKIDLLKTLNDSTTLVNYLQNRSAGYLNYYYSLVSNQNSIEHSNTNQIILEESNKYELILYNYLLENYPDTKPMELKKHKKIIINKL